MQGRHIMSPAGTTSAGLLQGRAARCLAAGSRCVHSVNSEKAGLHLVGNGLAGEGVGEVG